MAFTIFELPPFDTVYLHFRGKMINAASFWVEVALKIQQPIDYYIFINSSTDLSTALLTVLPKEDLHRISSMTTDQPQSDEEGSVSESQVD